MHTRSKQNKNKCTSRRKPLSKKPKQMNDNDMTREKSKQIKLKNQLFSKRSKQKLSMYFILLNLTGTGSE